jgi:NADH-quinone oxidoreductase subunit K
MVDVSLAAAFWSRGVGSYLSVALFVLGLVGLLTRREILKQLFAIKVMLQGVCLALINAGTIRGDVQTAQSMVISALIVEAVVMAVALALIVNVYRHYPSGDIDDLDRLRG